MVAGFRAALRKTDHTIFIDDENTAKLDGIPLGATLFVAGRPSS